MIFWITLFVAVICFLAFYFFDCDFLFGGLVFAGIALLVMIFWLCFAYIGLPGRVKADEQRYQSLVFQSENRLYENDNDIGKKELANQIQCWNEDLAMAKALQNDFWVGIFYPDVFDQFDFIPVDILGG